MWLGWWLSPHTGYKLQMCVGSGACGLPSMGWLLEAELVLGFSPDAFETVHGTSETLR